MSFIHVSMHITLLEATTIPLGCEYASWGKWAAQKSLEKPLFSHRSQQSIERGKIINFMSADVNNIIQFLNPAMADIVVAPITIIVAVGLLWRVIGCAHSSAPSSLLREDALLAAIAQCTRG